MHKEIWDADDLWGIGSDYDPLVAKCAKKKCGRAHDREDMYQSGRILVFLLTPKCRDHRKLTAYIKKSLLRCMGKVAKAWRLGQYSVSLDSIGHEFAVWRDEDGAVKVREDTVFDKRELSSEFACDEAVWLEYGEVMRSELTEREILVVQMRLAGMTHGEITKKFGRHRSVITKWIKRIGEKMAPYLKRRG